MINKENLLYLRILFINKKVSLKTIIGAYRGKNLY